MTNLFSLLLLLLFALLSLPLIYTTAALEILNNSTLYTYAGCWNETTELPGTTQQRTLSGGIQVSLPGAMTVPLCLGFCAGNDTSRRYAYAGLEYARECWCAGALSALSARLDDAACGDACDGDEGTACGGALRLSVYNLTEEARSGGVGMGRGRGRGEGGVWGALGLGSAVVGTGLALWIL